MYDTSSFLKATVTLVLAVALSLRRTVIPYSLYFLSLSLHCIELARYEHHGNYTPALRTISAL